jgi:hypothetical protein
MIEADPRLQDLIEDAARYRDIGRDTWADWSRLKRRLIGLVGWWAADDRLASSQCYQIAYLRLLRAWIGFENSLLSPRIGAVGLVEWSLLGSAAPEGVQ